MTKPETPLPLQKRHRRKLKSIWQLIRAEYYAVLIGNSEEEISWAIESLRKADERAKEEQ